MTQDEIIQGRDRLAKWVGWHKEHSSNMRGGGRYEYYWCDKNQMDCTPVEHWLPDQDDNQMRMVREKMNEEERNLFMNELVRLLESIEWFEMVNAPLDIQFECAIKAIGEQK